MFKNSSLTKTWFALKSVFATAFIFFGAQTIVAIVLYSVLAAMGKSEEQIADLLESNNTVILGFSFVVAGLAIALVVALLRWHKKPVKKYLLLDRKLNTREVGRVFVVYALYFVCLVFVTVLVDSLSTVNVGQEQELGLVSPRAFIDYVQIFIMLAVLPPIFEEILFRGFLFQTLRRRIGLISSAIMTSVLFGAAHLEYENLNWIAAIDTLIFSGFLIYLVHKQKSLYGAMLLHAIKNSIAFYVLFVHG
jgi:membrane protease YdiL (CAAX protease family)